MVDIRNRFSRIKDKKKEKKRKKISNSHTDVFSQKKYCLTNYKESSSKNIRSFSRIYIKISIFYYFPSLKRIENCFTYSWYVIHIANLLKLFTISLQRIAFFCLDAKKFTPCRMFIFKIILFVYFLKFFFLYIFSYT